MTDSSIRNNETANRFEMTADGRTATLSYRLERGAITLVHTAVPKQLEGRGIGSKLAAAALEFARAKGLTVVPLCPFVASYIQKHPEFLDTVREDYRARVT